jgi:hypothetical protein
MIDSPAFKRWFGKSKVVGKDKQPLVVYHGSKRPFHTFDYAYWGQTDPGFAGKGFYFMDAREWAEGYALVDAKSTDQPTVIEAYLRMENPLVVDQFHEVPGYPATGIPTKAQAEYMQRLVRARGYDGIIVQGRKGNPSEYVVFDPRQIKSATGNVGTFDPNDADIRHNPRAPKPRGRTLVERGMPTKWWHGTRSQFTTLKPQSSGCVWLADRAGATKYATPYYSKPGHRWLLELDLAPDTSVVELADSSDPIVRAYIDMINDAAKYGRLPYTYEDWAKQDINFGILETNRWSRGFFRKYGVDALIVRDVAGWGGYESMPSLCLLNTKKIQQTQRHALNNPATARRTDPALWERIVAEVTAGDKGGRPGQWSARKAQLAVALYRQQGGGYIGPKTPDNALAKWTREKWRTRSGRPSLETGERYLPTKALAALSPQEYGATTRAKRTGMAAGQQFVPQPERIAMKTAKYRRNGAPSIFDADGAAYFDREALEDAEDAARAYKSREAVVFLTPAEFLGLARSGTDEQKERTVLNVLAQGHKFNSVPFLRFDHVEGSKQAVVTGHEGRHRVRALQALGVRQIPVVLKGAIRWDQQLDPSARDYDAFLPQTLAGEENNRKNVYPMPIPIHHPELAARMRAKRNPAPVRRARRNPNYPNVSVYRGVLTSPEGRIRVKQIGKGQFSVAYLSEEPRPRVFLFTSGDVYDKEILMFAHDRLPNNPHLPAVEEYGDTRDGKTVWTMPLYKAPLKKADNETAWKQYLALKRCREALYKPRGVKSGYQVNYDVYECAIAAGVSPKLANALEHLISTAADYDEEYVFEFSPRNLATDAEGHLVLLDVLYHRRMLFRKLGAAAARGF